MKCLLVAPRDPNPNLSDFLFVQPNHCSYNVGSQRCPLNHQKLNIKIALCSQRKDCVRRLFEAVGHCPTASKSRLTQSFLWLHPTCGWVNHLDWLSSSYIQIHVPGPKSGVQQLKIVRKPNFGPILWVLKWVFMGFMGFLPTKCV